MWKHTRKAANLRCAPIRPELEIGGKAVIKIKLVCILQIVFYSLGNKWKYGTI